MAPLRASLAASRPPPRAAPRRRGVPPPGPPGLRPLWPLGHGPLLPADQRGGASAARRPKAGGFPHSGEISKR